MADLSIKANIRANVKRILDPLIGENLVRKIEWKHSLDLEEETRPALHLVFGHETPSEVNESFAAYYMEVPLFIRAMLRDGSEPLAASDALQAGIEAKLEADHTLGGYAASIVPEGLVPYTSEVHKPNVGFIMTYVILYNRLKADPYKRC